jgi:hypothetical protein
VNNERDFPNSGILFRNDNRQNDRHPNYRGEIDITCPDCGNRYPAWLSGWVKRGKRGKFLSLAIKPKEPRPEPDLESAPSDDDSLDF